MGAIRRAMPPQKMAGLNPSFSAAIDPLQNQIPPFSIFPAGPPLTMVLHETGNGLTMAI
jgi:hypothetical protein